MSWSIAGLAAVLVVWSLFARRLSHWQVTPALILVLAGTVFGWLTDDALAGRLEARVVEPIIEAILAIVLFEHATRVHGGFFGGHTRIVLRLLFIALPIGVVLAVILGAGLMPSLTLAQLLVLACVVVPVDFAPVVSFLHDPRIPERVRHVFNIEEGYSDGVIAPVFLLALTIASGEHTRSEGVIYALRQGIPHVAIAVVLGVAIGASAAWCANAADRRGLMTEQSRRLLMLGVPVLTYSLNVGLHGNGIVAAFVGGIAYHSVRHYVDEEREQEYIDDVGFVLAAVVWFVFGAVVWEKLHDGVAVGQVVFGVLVLTAVRAISVAAATVRSPLSGPERVLLAWLGPRGTANVALALWAYIVIPPGPGDTLLSVAIVVVLGSVVLHGVAAPILVSRMASRATTEVAR
ncbi:sodium/proton antiporter (CPA1 family) [Mycobacterium sp. BK558]|nr:sodium/proton antiporter (CPA1 family) [Mycobacterium sp. BK558]